WFGAPRLDTVQASNGRLRKSRMEGSGAPPLFARAPAQRDVKWLDPAQLAGADERDKALYETRLDVLNRLIRIEEQALGKTLKQHAQALGLADVDSLVMPLMAEADGMLEQCRTAFDAGTGTFGMHGMPARTERVLRSFDGAAWRHLDAYLVAECGSGI